MTKTKINTGAAVENHRQKDQGNVSPKWIGAIQRQVKIGDTVNVKTNKCCSVDEGMSGSMEDDDGTEVGRESRESDEEEKAGCRICSHEQRQRQI